MKDKDLITINEIVRKWLSEFYFLKNYKVEFLSTGSSFSYVFNRNNYISEIVFYKLKNVIHGYFDNPEKVFIEIDIENKNVDVGSTANISLFNYDSIKKLKDMIKSTINTTSDSEREVDELLEKQYEKESMHTGLTIEMETKLCKNKFLAVEPVYIFNLDYLHVGDIVRISDYHCISNSGYGLIIEITKDYICIVFKNAKDKNNCENIEYSIEDIIDNNIQIIKQKLTDDI